MIDIVSPMEEAITNADEVWEALGHSAVAEAIPIIDRLVKVLRATKRISDSLLAAKLLSFVRDPSLQTPEARAQMRERARSEDAKKIGETLFLVLERLTDMQKPKWLAKVFAAYLCGEITASDIRRLSSAIDIAFGDDLIELISSPEGTPLDEAAWKRNLLPSGLVGFHVIVPIGGSKTAYYVTDLGQMLRKAVRDH
ncbi:MAG: hypothetical protein ACREU3_04160 [Steroidobacteraceae bacterium]